MIALMQFPAFFLTAASLTRAASTLHWTCLSCLQCFCVVKWVQAGATPVSMLWWSESRLEWLQCLCCGEVSPGWSDSSVCVVVKWVQARVTPVSVLWWSWSTQWRTVVKHRLPVLVELILLHRLQWEMSKLRELQWLQNVAWLSAVTVTACLRGRCARVPFIVEIYQVLVACNGNWSKVCLRYWRHQVNPSSV